MVYFVHSVLSYSLQAYTGAPPTDEKEKIIWVRFEKADINGKFIVLNALFGRLNHTVDLNKNDERCCVLPGSVFTFD